nr:hypothetical protein CFP56_77557 [Quercus suber]
MAIIYDEYNVEEEIEVFFAKTSVTRSTCDLRTKELVGGDVAIVSTQGSCSYTVYAGYDANTVVQFRLKSLALPSETVSEAHRVYGNLAPDVKFEGQFGEDIPGKESLYVYVMPRMKGISRTDFVLTYGFPEDTSENCARRLTLIVDVARFFALSWKSPRRLSTIQSEELRQTYKKDLRLLLSALPARFHSLLEHCLDALPAIMALPKVFTHNDFGEFNLLVEPETCHFLGVIDWAEASTEPFGVNLYCLQRLMGKFHLRNGCIRYIDYDVLHDAFWSTLRTEIDDRTDETYHAIRSAMILGTFRMFGFTGRLANQNKPVPISDDQRGSYNMRHLDGWFINPETRMRTSSGPFLNLSPKHGDAACMLPVTMGEWTEGRRVTNDTKSRPTDARLKLWSRPSTQRNDPSLAVTSLVEMYDCSSSGRLNVARPMLYMVVEVPDAW